MFHASGGSTFVIMPAPAEDGILRVLQGKGAILILDLLAEEPRVGFNQLEESCRSEISHSTLSNRLSELEELNLIDRRSSDERPPRTYYTLTEKGERAVELLNQIQDLDQ